jgi:SUZ domain-containing RNA-binding protein
MLQAVRFCHCLVILSLTVPSAPPLSGLPNPSASNTPPLVIQARKIMRRPDEPKTSETSTAANSEGPSAAASEVDGDNGMMDPSPGPGSDSKARTALTREEREAKYAEVRERIFGKVEEGGETNDTGVLSDDNEDSRASSTTGKKKTINKQRNLSNDDFEPRSQFYGSNPVSNGYSNDQFYYQTYPTAHQHSPYPMQQANGNPSMSYVPGYPTPGPVDSQPQYWQNSQYQMQPPVVNMGNYPQLQNTAYDLSSHFNASMQSFQAAPPNGHFPGKIPSPMMSPYPQQPPPSQWTQPSYEHNYQYPRPGYSSAGAADRAVPPSSAMMQPQVQYPYGQYPMAPPNPMAPKSFIPGNQHRPQFNPQIQSFVPGGPSQRSMGMQPNVTAYGPPAGVSLPMQPMNRPAVAQNQPDNRHPSSQRPAATSTPIPNTAAQNVVMNQDASTATPPNSSSSPPSTSVGAKPVLEITAKWGTPAHLPPKPPPPESMEPHKYMEINKGLHQQFPGLPRLSSNGYGTNGFNGNGSNRFGP